MDRLTRFARIAAVSALAVPLAGCDWIVLSPAGDVAQQQGQLVVWSTILMLLIIVPVMALTALFAWRYRASNTEATYDPEWDHSTHIELVVWAAPLLIIICLGALTWVGTHLLDPYRKLGRIDAKTPVTAAAKPLEVDVVALDWKWLFVYPEQGVATVNELVVPTGRPLDFRITSSSVMNSFFVPAMAGQIYAMPGMETRLSAVMNQPGQFTGFSANYSGAGFAGMRFPTRAVSDAEFAGWAASVKAGQAQGAVNGGNLDRAAYLALAKPSENVKPTHYAAAMPGLFDAVADMCVEPGKMCRSEMKIIDAHGGLGKEGVRNVSMLSYDKFGHGDGVMSPPGAAVERELAYVRALCAQKAGKAPDRSVPAPSDTRSLGGVGLTLPGRAAQTGEPR